MKKDILDFKSTNYLEFTDRFKTDQDCSDYLWQLKWGNGYTCERCGSTEQYKGHNASYIRCKSCGHDASPTSNTIFHKLKFSLLKSFHICYRVSVHKKGVSSTSLSDELGLRQKTCWAFKRKIQEAMKSSGSAPLTGDVDVDECAIGGKDTGSQGRNKGDKKLFSIAVEILGEGKMGRAYGVGIVDYSAKELEKIFDKHISIGAAITTDGWTGYMPLQNKWNIQQVYSSEGANFPEIHILIMNLKNWLRGIHHKCSEEHIMGYIDEFFYRFNRRNNRKSIFSMLIKRMMKHPQFTHKEFSN